MIKQAIKKLVAPKEVIELENEILELNKKLTIANQRIASLSKLAFGSQPKELNHTDSGKSAFDKMQQDLSK